jgi:peptide/nickel transport system permease protein
LVPIIVAISMISFLIIELPPGDYLTMYIIQLEQSGTRISDAEIARLTRQYGLNKPLHTRYLKWMWNIISKGNFGRSFQHNKPVAEVIGERIVLTVVISLFSLIFVWVVALPIGIYSATHQYSLLDYVVTFLGFIGLATPNFLLALIFIYFAHAYFGLSLTGLFSSEYMTAPWSVAKVWDMFKHLWVPIIVVGMAGTAQLIRVMRGTLLDELGKPYVETARAKGLPERRLLFKYPVRIAINPMISTIGWLLPYIVSGSTIASVVLNLPTTGPMLLRSLMYQDMYLAGSFVLMLSVLTAIGTLLSDILLAWVDPRIRYEGVAT